MSSINLRIYVTRLNNAIPASLEQEYLSEMPPEIRSSIRRYHRWQDRQATLFGKLLLSNFLQSQFPDTWQHKLHTLETNQFGRPFLQSGPDFNISHSGDFILLAVADNGTVGIDIEKIRPISRDDYPEHITVTSEIHGTDPHQHTDSFFFDCWTKKEAALKGYGSGLSVPLEEVIIRGNKTFIHQSEWHSTKLNICECYSCHIATSKPPQQISIMHQDFIKGC